MIYSGRIVPQLLERYDEWAAENNSYMHQDRHDQQLIDEWHDRHPEAFSVRPFSELNSWWFEMDPNNFVFHFMAREQSEKVDLIKNHVKAWS